MSLRNLASRRAATSNLLPVGGIVSPQSLPSLQGWWDFSDSSRLFTGTNGTGAVTNGSAIAYCQDRSGSGNHLTQSTANSRPTWNSTGINSLGAGSYANGPTMQSPVISALGDSDATMFVVATRSSTSTGAQMRLTDGSTKTFGVSDGNSGATYTANCEQFNNFTYTYSSAITASVIALSRVGGNNGNQRFFRNGAEVYPTSGSTGTGRRFIASPYFQIGRGATEAHSGLIAEAAIYNRFLSVAEIVAITRLLGAKWGITVA